MRCRITIFWIAVIVGAGAANGQGQSTISSRSINRNWPDVGVHESQLPSSVRPSWDGNDAVGLQFRDHSKATPESNLVPVALLRLSGEALKEMRKSDKALIAGDVRGSAEHLEKMMALTPNLAIGHNSLGTRYVVLKEYDKAIAEFQKAVALQPRYRLAVDNMAVAMCMQHIYMEAEPVARWALQIEPEATTSRYLLGSILVSEGKATEEASSLLRSVQEQYPRARLFLANWFVLRGETQPAAEELRAYLNSPKATDNGVAKEWLERIEKELDAKKALSAQSSQNQ